MIGDLAGMPTPAACVCGCVALIPSFVRTAFRTAQHSNEPVARAHFPKGKAVVTSYKSSYPTLTQYTNNRGGQFAAHFLFWCRQNCISQFEREQYRDQPLAKNPDGELFKSKGGFRKSAL
jgi:hypothetical protein